MARETGMERMRMCCRGLGWGVFFLFLGSLWLARDMGWIPNVPIFPIVLIALGIGTLVNSLRSG